MDIFKRYYHKSIAQISVDSHLENKLASNLFQPVKPARGLTQLIHLVQDYMQKHPGRFYALATSGLVIGLIVAGGIAFPKNYVAAAQAITRSIHVVITSAYDPQIDHFTDEQVEQIKNNPNVQEFHYERTPTSEDMGVSGYVGDSLNNVGRPADMDAPLDPNVTQTHTSNTNTASVSSETAQ